MNFEGAPVLSAVTALCGVEASESVSGKGPSKLRDNYSSFQFQSRLWVYLFFWCICTAK